MLLSSGVGLTPEWQTITPPRILNTTEPWSEVLIEMPTLDFRGVGKRVLLADGTSLNVDAYLVTEDAKQINLEMAPMAFDTKVVLGYGPPCSTEDARLSFPNTSITLKQINPNRQSPLDVVRSSLNKRRGGFPPCFSVISVSGDLRGLRPDLSRG